MPKLVAKNAILPLRLKVLNWLSIISLRWIGNYVVFNHVCLKLNPSTMQFSTYGI